MLIDAPDMIASVTAISTIGAALIAAGIGLTFDGTPVPVAAGVLACTLVAMALMRRLTRTARALG